MPYLTLCWLQALNFCRHLYHEVVCLFVARKFLKDFSLLWLVRAANIIIMYNVSHWLCFLHNRPVSPPPHLVDLWPKQLLGLFLFIRELIKA